MKTKKALILVVFVVIAAGLAGLSYFGVGNNHLMSVRHIKQGLDLKGGVNIVYEADISPTSEEMKSAVSMMQDRLDRKGWTEAEVAQEGTKRIRVEIPGVEDAETAINEIGKTAQLTFVDEEGNVLVEGKNVKDAYAATSNQNGGTSIVVSLKFDSTGTEAFRQATKNNVGKMLIIMLDDGIISAPRVNSEIANGEAVITGDFTKESAEELAALIRAGSLPFKLNVLEMNNIGARLGANSLKTSIFAGIAGVSLVFLFMLIFYKLSGFAADWALVIYIGLDLVALSILGVTLTLPGIAGIILSIGMAVDANVIIFERIKEELNNGRTIRLALNNGFARAFPAILDSNITTLIAGIVLFWLGSGPVKGFAQTLMIGIVISMFTALVITRVLLNSMVGIGLNNPKLYGRK